MRSGRVNSRLLGGSLGGESLLLDLEEEGTREDEEVSVRASSKGERGRGRKREGITLREARLTEAA